MANLNNSICVCDHSEDSHFKYGGSLARGRCKLDGVNEHYCLQFESKTAEAERERLYQEKCERVGRIAEPLLSIFIGVLITGDTISFEREGHRYSISEVEDNER